MNRPKVLLLDEPLGALDLKLRREMQVELKQIQREVGITFVFVTHDQEEALTMSDRIAVFNEGRVQQLATPFELYEQPASAFVAGFVGTSNLLDGRVAKELVGEDGHLRRSGPRSWSCTPSPTPPPPTPETCVAPGVVREVVYLGASTHSIVELDAGTTLTVAPPEHGPLHRRRPRAAPATCRALVATRPPGGPGRACSRPGNAIT